MNLDYPANATGLAEHIFLQIAHGEARLLFTTLLFFATRSFTMIARDTSGANQTDGSRFPFLVALAKAGVQGCGY
jgi:hypothetical protein